MADGDPQGAAACLRDALGLWRGPALADLALVESLQAEVRRLEELRLVAKMALVDAELELGHHATLIAQLEALVAANPLQERFRAQLMLALYRAGRQADALEIYRKTSELLRDDLGLEPSRTLQELERSILHQEPRLESVAPAGFSPAGRLPIAPTPFLGRRRELAEVSAALRGARHAIGDIDRCWWQWEDAAGAASGR